MKKTSKIMSLVLAGAMVLSMSACGGSTAGTAADTTAADTAAATAAEAAETSKEDAGLIGIHADHILEFMHQIKESSVRTVAEMSGCRLQVTVDGIHLDQFFILIIKPRRPGDAPVDHRDRHSPVGRVFHYPYGTV